MIKLKRKLNTRELVLITATLIVVVGAPVFQRWLLPGYDQWRAMGALVDSQTIEYQRLVSNLEIKQSVDEQFKLLGENAWQSQSDQITLSGFLRDVEVEARYPGMTLINMKPLPVTHQETHSVYKVRLSVAGKLQDVLKFAFKLLNGETITGMESFSIRGTQGGNVVECSFSLWMVKLPAPESSPGPPEVSKAKLGRINNG